jgi:hypothetical protein
MLVCAVQGKALQLLRRQLVQLFVHTRHSIQGIVVKYHNASVLRELNVKLDAKSALAGKLKGKKRVFGHLLPFY